MVERGNRGVSGSLDDIWNRLDQSFSPTMREGSMDFKFNAFYTFCIDRIPNIPGIDWIEIIKTINLRRFREGPPLKDWPDKPTRDLSDAEYFNIFNELIKIIISKNLELIYENSEVEADKMIQKSTLIYGKKEQVPLLPPKLLRRLLRSCLMSRSLPFPP